jgi:Zn finger protein HypA/HybF involved in hydrogenase expression
MHLHTPCTWACWTCRTTAKAKPPHYPTCPQCQNPMRNMGTRWRPGRRGRWLSLAEIEALH